MNSLSIKQVLTLSPGSPVTCTGGKITAVQKQFNGPENGGWTVQDIMIEDGTGTIPVKIGNHPEIPAEQVGQNIYFVAHKKAKGGLSGVKVDTEEYQEAGQTKTFVLLAVSRSATLLNEEQYRAQAEATPPQQQQTELPQQPQQPQQPAQAPEQPAQSPQPEAKGTAPKFQVSELRYERTVNTGNYCSEKLGVTLALEAGTKVQAALEAAKGFVAKNLSKEVVPAGSKPVA